MDLKQIKDLMTAMEKSGIKKLSLKEKTGYELQMEREDEHPAPAPQVFQGHHQSAFHIPLPPRAHEHSSLPPPAPEAKVDEKQEGQWITSPMVGTFYATPSR